MKTPAESGAGELRCVESNRQIQPSAVVLLKMTGRERSDLMQLARNRARVAKTPPPSWAYGINICDARGRQWFQLIQYAGADPARLRQIQPPTTPAIHLPNGP